MGLDNANIAKMYVIEVSMIGVLSLLIGLGSGILFSKLFTMILLRISDISVDVSFTLSITSILITVLLFMGIFIIMIVKGYINILRSSVLEMLSAAKQNELKEEKGIISLLKVIVGLLLLVGGYYCALQVGDMSSFTYILYAVILVIVGIYFLYNGIIPFIITKLSKNKKYLYQKERVLWINNLAFRLKKNSYSIMSSKPLNEDEITKGISKTNAIDYHNNFNYLALNKDAVKTKFIYNQYGLVSYSQLKQAAKDAKIKFNLPALKDDEVINLTRLYLLDISDPENNPTIEINEETYRIVEEVSESYLGLIQENISTYVVNDGVYERLKSAGQEYYMYNYKSRELRLCWIFS